MRKNPYKSNQVGQFKLNQGKRLQHGPNNINKLDKSSPMLPKIFTQNSRAEKRINSTLFRGGKDPQSNEKRLDYEFIWMFDDVF